MFVQRGTEGEIGDGQHSVERQRDHHGWRRGTRRRCGWRPFAREASVELCSNDDGSFREECMVAVELLWLSR